MKRKLSWHFYAVCLIVLSVALTVFAYSTKDLEYSLEMSDLQAMRSAEMSARKTWNDTIPSTPAEYWYDAKEFSLIPTTQSKPVSYGLGTRKNGGSVRYFRAETGLNYIYNESENYEDKILHVTVSEKDGDLQIEMEWVKTD